MADGLSKGVERDDWKGEQNSDPRSSELRCKGRWVGIPRQNWNLPIFLSIFLNWVMLQIISSCNNNIVAVLLPIDSIALPGLSWVGQWSNQSQPSGLIGAEKERECSQKIQFTNMASGKESLIMAFSEFFIKNQLFQDIFLEQLS